MARAGSPDVYEERSGRAAEEKTSYFERSRSTRTQEQPMNDRRAKIGDDRKEGERGGLVHEGAGQCHGQGMRIDTRVSVRVATPRDGEKLRGMFSRVSFETIYRRFHMPYPDVPEWMLALMLDANHLDKEALVAVADEEIVGHAMYVRLGGGGAAGRGGRSTKG